MENKNDILAAELREFMRECKEQTSRGILRIDDADRGSLSKSIGQYVLNGFLSHISSNPALKSNIGGKIPHEDAMQVSQLTICKTHRDY